MADVQLSTLGSVIKTAYEGQANTNAYTDAEKTKLAGVESGATADQTDSEIETAYNNQVSVVSQAEAEAGTATTVRRWTAQRVAQAIAALAGSSTTDPSEYDYLNDGNQTGTYTPNFTSNPIIEITLTGNTEIQAPTHSGIASGDAFTGVLIVNPATYTLTFASGITNYNNQGSIATSGRLEFTLSTYDQATSWILAPAPQASEIRNDSGVTGATVDAALDALNGKLFQGLNDQTGTTYELVATDKRKLVTLNNASAVTVNVDTDGITWANGDQVFFLNKGAGTVTIQGGGVSAVTINKRSDQAATLSQYAMAQLTFVSDSIAVLSGGMDAA